MAKYRVTSPDGKTYEVTAPDSASQDEVMRYVQSNGAGEQASAGALASDAAPWEKDRPLSGGSTVGQYQPTPSAIPGPWDSDRPLSHPATSASAPEGSTGYARGMVNSGLQGLMLNFADEAYGGVGAAIDKLEGNNRGWGDLYASNRDQFRDQGKDFQKSHPYSSAAATIAGSVPLALVPAGAVAKATTISKAMLTGAEGGALFGGVSGFGAGEGGLANRATAAIGGATIGGALGAAVPAVGYGVGKVAQTGKRMLGLQNPENEARGLLLRALQGDELTPEQLSTKIGTYNGKPVTIADMADDNTRRLLDQISVQGGTGGKNVGAFLAQRQEDQGGRIIGDIKDALSPSTDTYGLDAKLNQIRSASNPLWEDAMNKPPVWNDRLAQFADEPAVKSGMAQGVKLARLDALAKGQPFDPKAYAVTGFNEAGDPIIGGVPTWRTWQAAKEGLDAQIADARGPLGQATKQSNALTDVKNALLKELDSTNPTYKAARAAWAGPSAQKDAIDLGGDFLKLDPEQIAARASKMAPDELQAFKVGAARALQDKVDTVKGLGDATKRIFNDNRTKDQIEAAFGQDAYRKFQQAMMTEKTMADTNAFVSGNSRTAQRILGAQDVGDQLAESFITGGTKSALARGIKMASNRARGLNGPTGAALSDMLTAVHPDAQKAALNRLIAYKMAQDAAQRRLLAAGAMGDILAAERASSGLASQ